MQTIIVLVYVLSAASERTRAMDVLGLVDGRIQVLRATVRNDNAVDTATYSF